MITGAHLSTHDIHKVRSEYKWSPFSLETLEGEGWEEEGEYHEGGGRGVVTFCEPVLLTMKYLMFPRKCPKSIWKRFPPVVTMMLSL